MPGWGPASGQCPQETEASRGWGHQGHTVRLGGAQRAWEAQLFQLLPGVLASLEFWGHAFHLHPQPAPHLLSPPCTECGGASHCLSGS